jgi:hypothetical protein
VSYYRPTPAARLRAVLLFTVCTWTLVLAVLFATAASAHTPEVTSSCTQGLHVKLKAYDRDTKVTITVDGDTANALQFTFTGDFEYTYSLRPSYLPHDYLVQIDNAGTRYDKGIEGRQAACTEPPTTTPPTTTVPSGPTFPATPPCPYPGKGVYDYNDPNCTDVRSEILTPAVEEAPVAQPTAQTPAFTG